MFYIFTSFLLSLNDQYNSDPYRLISFSYTAFGCCCSRQGTGIYLTLCCLAKLKVSVDTFIYNQCWHNSKVLIRPPKVISIQCTNIEIYLRYIFNGQTETSDSYLKHAAVAQNTFPCHWYGQGNCMFLQTAKLNNNTLNSG